MKISVLGYIFKNFPKWAIAFILSGLINPFSCTLQGQNAFPGAIGFGAGASGGRGGQVIYVTNLNINGPGSLQDALNQVGTRYILFKVAGVIDGTVEVPNGNGNFTIAGQTSPGGITVRGFQMYNNDNPSVNNVIIRHLRSRIGDINLHPTGNWLGGDGITIGGVQNAIIDHCSFQHAVDEAIDISRTSNLTIQNCVLGETLGDHGYLGGMLINYSDAQSPLNNISLHYNVWNRIGGRMPEISCETPYCNEKHIQIELSNNLYWDPQIELWYEGNTNVGNGHFYLNMNAVNNLYHSRTTYGNAMFHFDLLNYAENHLYFSGSKMNLYPDYSDYQLFYCCNDFYLYHPNTDMGIADRMNNKHPFYDVAYTDLDELPGYIARNSGAFPRDPMDLRFASYITNNTIPDLPVNVAGADDAFLTQQTGPPQTDSDSDGMPDYWETAQGLINGTQDHNGTQLSIPITGVSGYTNLECYLNCLSDALVHGKTTPECQIAGFPLPITFLDFKAVGLTESHTSELSWQTTFESSVNHFDIQRSIDGTTWQKIGTVIAKNNHSEKSNYHFTDVQPLIKNYYRLQVVDMNGQIFFSPIRVVNIGNKEDIKFSIYPNPTNGNFIISGSPGEVFTICDFTGKIVKTEILKSDKTAINFSHMKEGIYFVRLGNQNLKLIVL